MLLLASYSCCCFCCWLVASACCRCHCWLQLLLLWLLLLLLLLLRLLGWLCVAMCWLCWGRIGGVLLALSFSLGHGMLRFPAILLLPKKSPSVVSLPSFRHPPLGHKCSEPSDLPSFFGLRSAGTVAPRRDLQAGRETMRHKGAGKHLASEYSTLRLRQDLQFSILTNGDQSSIFLNHYICCSEGYGACVTCSC